MNPFYTRARATTKRMLAKYGMPYELRRTNFDGSISTFSGLALKVSTVQKILGDTNVQLGDDNLLMYGDEVPKHGDRIIYGSENRVVSQPVDTFDPAGDMIYMTCYARKG